MSHKEEAGQPYIGPDAEAIKQRVSARADVEELFNQFDPSQPDQYLALVTNGHTALLSDEGELPNVAYALSHLLKQTMNIAEQSESPQVSAACRAAVLAAMTEETPSSEVHDNEDNQPRATN